METIFSYKTIGKNYKYPLSDMVDTVANMRASSASSGASNDSICKRLLSGAFLVTCGCLSIMYTIHKQNTLPSYEDTSTFEDRVFNSVVSDSNIKTSRRPEVKLQTYCMGASRIDRHCVTSIIFSKTQLLVQEQSAVAVVQITTFTINNISKHEGGDVIIIWAKKSKGDGLVSGHVIDNGDGSYSGIIRTYWIGISSIHVKLASSIENTCLRFKALQKYGNIVYTLKHPQFILAYFKTNNGHESTVCNTNNFIYGSNKTCNFTTMNGGMSWFCGHPKCKLLQCQNVDYFSTASLEVDEISVLDTIQYPWHGVFETSLSVNITLESLTNTKLSCKTRKPFRSWKEPIPTGFWMRGTWRMTNCHSSLKHTVPVYRTCLRNKTLILLGDSTIRQYANIFLKQVLNSNIKIPGNTFGPNGAYHGYTNFINYGINVIYRKRAMPLHYLVGRVPIKNILSFPQILDTMRKNNIKGSSVIVLIQYHTHFLSFPPARYRERLRLLSASVKRFLEVKPFAKVFIKGPHVCISDDKWWDPRISLLFKEILEEEFEDIMDKVIYLNTWDISVAHNNQDVHPQGNAFTSQIQQFMSYIC